MSGSRTSSSSAGASKTTKVREPRMQDQGFPISTIGQGQGLLLGQATPQAQSEARRSQETSEELLGHKEEKKSSMRSALSSIKDKAKRFSFSSSSSKDNTALPESEAEAEKAKAKEVEEDKRRTE
ncbi:uncharacterized protein N0V89_011513 [Didymosphaeria variabile]|uniref:Uncharacterized protein n=1 Tax=Didymosphaeria variabile TaxID=1932322 RepID=A0A9W8XAP4_9PLEO|nr:uncharacterized protein N0V89_011513 [Didymosphaeria variabile]KAJ4345383.1 hypothetical protein N0V89_011513 [Didymosphaeria variabile]